MELSHYLYTKKLVCFLQRALATGQILSLFTTIAHYHITDGKDGNKKWE